MDKRWKVFEVQRRDSTMIMTPLRSLGEFIMLDFEEETELILEFCNQNQICKLLIDLGETEYLESTALDFLIALHNQVAANEGRMACCHPSSQETRVLEIANLNEVIPTFDTRESALEFLRQPT